VAELSGTALEFLLFGFSSVVAMFPLNVEETKTKTLLDESQTGLPSKIPKIFSIPNPKSQQNPRTHRKLIEKTKIGS
jgi:hypothetical protein